MRISDWSSDVCSSDLLGPHVPGALRLPGLRGPGTKKPPQGGDFVTTGCAASAMQFAGGLRLVLDRQHAQVDVAVAGHRPVDALAHAQAQQDRKSTRLNSSH